MGRAGQLQLFSSSLVDAHNRFRQQHGAAPLICSSSLSRKAQQWAEALVGMRALKSSGMDYGENLWYRQATTGQKVAEAWYSENTKYNFSTPGFQSGSGNFTQMVWKSSLQMGIGLAQDGDGLFIVVAFFDPAGNITNQGYFEKNVQAPATRGLSIKLP
uniref:SCP domain-containing protein n=1 Tax=Erpetoichthys calabaricus TaxID=27687 RepID=A0A8C4T5B2_ERPCA